MMHVWRHGVLSRLPRQRQARHRPPVRSSQNGPERARKCEAAPRQERNATPSHISMCTAHHPVGALPGPAISRQSDGSLARCDCMKRLCSVPGKGLPGRTERWLSRKVGIEAHTHCWCSINRMTLRCQKWLLRQSDGSTPRGKHSRRPARRRRHLARFMRDSRAI